VIHGYGSTRWTRVAQRVYIRGPETSLLENQLDFLLLFLTSFQESLRALCPLRVTLDSGSSTHSIQLPTPGSFCGTIHTP
jgi:hypothetical protein